MGWSIGFDSNWQRDIGYGVPCTCDHPECDAEINRGLACVCGGEPHGGDDGCGLFFCGKHLVLGVEGKAHQVCERCETGEEWGHGERWNRRATPQGDKTLREALNDLLAVDDPHDTGLFDSIDKYHGTPTHRCLGCREKVPRAAWGPWCHPCNVKRMTRINGERWDELDAAARNGWIAFLKDQVDTTLSKATKGGDDDSRMG